MTRATFERATRARPRLRRKRRWDDFEDEDPLASIANLFDVALVFTIALVMALAARAPHALLDVRQAQRLDHYRATRETVTGEGTRLGTAYRLPNGDVVYVPDGKE